MLAEGDKDTITELRQNVLKSQLAVAEQLDREMQDFWERASSTRDAALAGHLAAQAAQKTEQLRQALSNLPEEHDASSEFIVTFVRGLQRGNEATADAVRALSKLFAQMAEAAHTDDLELQAAAEQACGLLDQVFRAAGDEDEENSEGDHE
jgi:hypothetical protein